MDKFFVRKFILMIIAYMIIPSIIAIIFVLINLQVPLYFFTIFEILIFLIPVFYLIKEAGGNPSDVLKINFNFSPKIIVFLLWGYVGVSLFNPGWQIIQGALIPESFSSFYEDLLNKQVAQQIELISIDNTLSFFYVLIFVAIIPAICEEVLFRGYFLQNLKIKNYSNLFIVLISSIIFSAIHLNLIAFVNLFVMGCFLGYITIAVNSLVPAIIFHFFNNMTAVVMEAIKPGASVNENLYLTDNIFIGILLCVIGIIIMVISYKKSLRISSLRLNNNIKQL